MRFSWGPADDDHGHHRSRGNRADAGGRGRSNTRGSRRNPLTAPAETDEPTGRSPRGKAEVLAPIAEEAAEARAAERPARHKRKHHASSTDKTVATSKGPVGLTHLMFLLVGLAMGAVLLISMEHLYSVMSKAKKEEAEAVAAVKAPPPAAPLPPPKPAQLATRPTEAITLMLSAAAKGDVTTAYAQWDIGPDDLATLKRGQEMTLADVVAKAQGAPEATKNLQLRLLSQTGDEARVGQFQRASCLQIFSLRKRGGYWKLYNASAP